MARTADDGRGTVFALHDLGNLEKDLGNLDAAERLLEEAQVLARGLGERFTEGQIALQVADINLRQGRALDAFKTLRDVSILARKFGSKRLLAEAEKGLGEATLAMGNLRVARAHAERAIAIAERAGVASYRWERHATLAQAVARGAVPSDDGHGLQDVVGNMDPRALFDRAMNVLEKADAELELGRALEAFAGFEASTGNEAAAAALRERIGDAARRSLLTV